MNTYLYTLIFFTNPEYLLMRTRPSVPKVEPGRIVYMGIGGGRSFC